MARTTKPKPPYSGNTLWCTKAIQPIVHAVACPRCEIRAGNPCRNLMFEFDESSTRHRKRKQRMYYQNYVHAQRRHLYNHQLKHGLLVPYEPPQKDIIDRNRRAHHSRRLDAYTTLERELLDAHAESRRVSSGVEDLAVILAALARKLRRSPSGG